MKVETTYYPTNEIEIAALKLLGIKVTTSSNDAPPIGRSFGDPEREHRVLGAYLNVMSQTLIP